MDPFTIQFKYTIDSGPFHIMLIADVRAENSIYVICNFRRIEGDDGSLLPEMQLKKINGKWVHKDSAKETELSMIIGDAIDAYHRQQPSIAD